MKNIKLMRVRLFALAVAVAMAIVLTSAPEVNAQDKMSGIKMGQGAKKKAAKKTVGKTGKQKRGMKGMKGMKHKP